RPLHQSVPHVALATGNRNAVRAVPRAFQVTRRQLRTQNNRFLPVTSLTKPLHLLPLMQMRPSSNNSSTFLQEQERQRSLNDPEGFWMEAQRGIDWIEPPTRALEIPDPAKPHKVNWFPGAKLNVSYNALDRHVNSGRKEQVAMIYDSPVTNQIQKFTYEQLLHRVIRAATMLRNNGVKKGDTVLIYMGMVPEAI
ncbi:hypothetical protein LPJ57_009103, partial [Coemansia sp. RSA 486]